jgi:diadenosine tetraphosphate (Ap4A) HIT family hydrolase
MECLTCKSNSGEQRISPGPTIYEGEYWLVEHAYPIRRVGWLVIVLKRHAEALHDLSVDEFTELGRLQSLATRFLNEELHCQKEYISCYGEAEGFAHIHFYVFAKPADLPEELKGGKSFNLLKASPEEAIPSGEIVAFCELLQNKFEQQAGRPG